MSGSTGSGAGATGGGGGATMRWRRFGAGLGQGEAGQRDGPAAAGPIGCAHLEGAATSPAGRAVERWRGTPGGGRDGCRARSARATPCAGSSEAPFVGVGYLGRMSQYTAVMPGIGPTPHTPTAPQETACMTAKRPPGRPAYGTLEGEEVVVEDIAALAAPGSGRAASPGCSTAPGRRPAPGASGATAPWATCSPVSARWPPRCPPPELPSPEAPRKPPRPPASGAGLVEMTPANAASQSGTSSCTSSGPGSPGPPRPDAGGGATRAWTPGRPDRSQPLMLATAVLSVSELSEPLPQLGHQEVPEATR